MYTSFYNLNKKPFQISSDPAFMWFGEKHKEALATLKYGILDNKGFLLLTGDVGTGKTTLINTLIQTVNDDIICTSVPDPGLEKLDFFNYIAAGFGIDHEFSTKGTFLAHFRKFLLNANENNKKVLLIIDEAQLLTQEMLEEIRLLSNIEKTDAKLINIFFVGQNEFNEILNREQNRAVRQRLTLNYNIDPLTPDETGDYIKHRLSVAGATSSIFDESATQEIFIYSGGFPRRINVICDHSLLSGYVKEQKIIDSAIVKECAKELKIPAHIRNRDINGFAYYHEQPVPVAKSQPHPSQSYQSQKGTVVEKRKKRGFQYFLSAILCLLFFVIVWFNLFPNDYVNSKMVIQKNLEELKYKISQIIPEPYSSFFKQQNENIENIYNDPTDSPMKENQKEMAEDQIQGEIKDSDRIIESSLTQGKIQPIQEEILKEKNIKPDIYSQKEVESETLSTKETFEKEQGKKKSLEGIHNETRADESDIKIEKKILSLPLEKVVVRFKYNTNDFTEEGFKKLVEYANILSTHPEANILIVGYTDSEGYQKYNRKLSEFRANIVRSFFLGKGIKAEQMQIKGLGSKNPIEDNQTAWGRRKNRRVEIEIIKEKAE